jgi:hypothetical protein
MELQMKPRLLGLAFALAIALVSVWAFQLGRAADANAAVYGFCENVHLGGNATCEEGGDTTYQAYAWGDDHSVCVGLAPAGLERCSGGAGQGVYSGEPENYTVFFPYVKNNAAGENWVHGDYLTH